MKRLSDQLKTSKKWLQGVAIIIISIGFSMPSSAFIPYVYEPNQKKLQETAISIGKTAAHLLQVDQSEEAIRLAKLAIRLKPKDYRIWSILGEAQRRKGLLSNASKSLAKARELNPAKSSLWFAEATLHLQTREPKKAIKLIREGLQRDPLNAVAYFQLGNARIMQTKPLLALNSFEKATELKPIFWEALNNQGIVLYEINKTKKAINIWKKVLEIERNAEPMLALAAALNEVNPKNTESIELAKEALKKDPNYISPYHQEEQLWGKKLQKAAKQLLERPELASATEQALANSDVKMFQTK